jgi:hypothetical protein
VKDLDSADSGHVRLRDDGHVVIMAATCSPIARQHRQWPPLHSAHAETSTATRCTADVSVVRRPLNAVGVVACVGFDSAYAIDFATNTLAPNLGLRSA